MQLLVLDSSSAEIIGEFILVAVEHLSVYNPASVKLNEGLPGLSR